MTVRSARTVLIASIAGALAGCQAAVPVAPAPAGRSAALVAMEHVTRAAQACWFASRDPAFAQYRLANELNSFSGRPRILLVPARSPESRPLLVVQAEGAQPKVDAFGPLMSEPAGVRIAADLRRWTGGSSACADGA